VDSADSMLALSSKIVFEGDVGEPMTDLRFGAVVIYQWIDEAIGEKAGRTDRLRILSIRFVESH